MYLLKQWRESRILSAIAAVSLVLLLLLVVKGVSAIDSMKSHGNDTLALGMMFVPLFYAEIFLIGFWSWLIAGIGVGKNLGEDSGAFLFTRPRRRAWFLWNDWGFAMGQITLIILITNLIFAILLNHIRVLMHLPMDIPVGPDGRHLSMIAMFVLVSVGVLLFSGLVYSVSYFSTILTRRSIGVMLGAGLFVAYLVTRAVLHHFYPALYLPNLIPPVFQDDAQGKFFGLSSHLAYIFAARAAFVMVFPIAAHILMSLSEI